MRFTLKLTLASSLTLAVAVTAASPALSLSIQSAASHQSATDLEAEVSRLASQLKSSDEEERFNAVIMLVALDSPATTDALVSASGDSSERVRAAALKGIGNLSNPSLVHIVSARLLQDKSVFVRKMAAYALGRMKTHDGTAALVAALRHKDAEVRSAAAVAIGEYEDASAITPLMGALTDKADFVRAQAARALGVNGRAASAAVPALVRVLANDENNEAQRQAAIALGRIGDRSALRALEQAQRDPDPYLSRAALDSIEMIRRQH